MIVALPDDARASATVELAFLVSVLLVTQASEAWVLGTRLKPNLKDLQSDGVDEQFLFVTVSRAGPGHVDKRGEQEHCLRCVCLHQAVHKL